SLQHTNIVPIYSFHQVGKLQAVCMPFYGATTLAHVLAHLQRLAGLPTSGKELITTVHARRSVTSPDLAAGSSQSGASDEQHDSKSDHRDPRTCNATWRLLEGMSFTNAVLWLACRILDGLVHAHEHGVLHRDLKPANILLTDDGTPMLLDFNLAAGSELRGDPAGARIGGTLPYMAPEHMRAFQSQGQGAAASPVRPDQRSDLYSLGVTFFNLLTGRD